MKAKPPKQFPKPSKPEQKLSPDKMRELWDKNKHITNYLNTLR